MIVIAQAPGEVSCPDKVHFTGIGLELSRLLNHRVRGLKTRGSVILSFVKKKMRPSELAVSPEKARVTSHGLFEQSYRFTRALAFGGLAHAECLQVNVVGDQVARGRTRDSG